MQFEGLSTRKANGIIATAIFNAAGASDQCCARMPGDSSNPSRLQAATGDLHVIFGDASVACVTCVEIIYMSSICTCDILSWIFWTTGVDTITGWGQRLHREVSRARRSWAGYCDRRTTASRRPGVLSLIIKDKKISWEPEFRTST